MMSRLAVVVVLVAMLYSQAESKAAKCAKPAKNSGVSQITLSPAVSAAAGQFAIGSAVSSACNCTKGQAVYNVAGSTNTSTTGPPISVACNTTTNFAVQLTNGKKLKLKKPANLLSPPVLIFSYSNAKGKTVNLLVLNCPVTGASGNSSSSVTFNKKAGLNKKWNCGKQNGAKGTKASPIFGSKKGKKYPKVKAVSCSGKKGLKKCKVGSSTTSG
jgi:hypothetical protein